jgi:predicted small metal-binding protein
LKDGFYIHSLAKLSMTIKLACKDYGFECEYVVEGEGGSKLLEQLRSHFEDEHGIDYAPEFLIQMVTNKGHSRESLTKA